MNLSLLKRLFAKKNTLKFGFSFNDLTLIISTVAIVTVSAIAINSVENAKRNQLADSKKIEAIYRSIGNFALKFKRLPCPAGLNKIVGVDTSYGDEIGSGSTCTSGNGVYELSANSNILYGAIPNKTLGLSSDYSFDQYGSKFVYVIDKRATFDIASVNPVNFGNIEDNIISIKENDNLIGNNLLLIISYGKDKSGAFNANSSNFNPLPQDSVSEIDNLFSTISGNIVNFSDTIFVKSIKGDINFDDTIFSKSKTEFINDFNAFFLIPCKDAGDLFGNKNASFGEIVFAKSNCPYPNDQIRSAKRCSNQGKWIYDKSCPCYLEIDGVETSNVPNGVRFAKCTKFPYSGNLKYACKDNGSLEIIEYCKRSCTFNAIGISTIIPSGSSEVAVDCNLQNYKGSYKLMCEDGVITSQKGSCLNSTCIVGGYSGMKQLTVDSGASRIDGSCDEDAGYSGSYSYSCVDGIPFTTNKCYKNCNFNTVGLSINNLKHGQYFYNCPTSYKGKGITVVCENGNSYIKSGTCSIDSKCIVGNGIGMVSQSADYNTTGTGACQTGYSGSYSFACTATGSTSFVNNCVVNNCKIGTNIVGLTEKTASLNTSGIDGQCAPGFGGFFKWNCDANGNGTVTENNCVNSCEVGTASQGEGMRSDVVGYGKSGDLGQCDSSRGYAGNYTWSCLLNASTNKVEPKVITNNCVNYCQVGTLAQGIGMKQRNAPLNSSGKNEPCASGYIGNYEWSCDANGKASIISNKCINSCNVGIYDQGGAGMITKSVNLNTSGTDGQCNTTSGYGGSYSWSCSSAGVGKVTANNCICSSSSDKCLKNCLVGTKSHGIGMLLKIVSINTSGNDGSCDNANDYWGNFSWSCSSVGVSRVTQNNCKKSVCDLPTGYEGLGNEIASGTSGLLICSNGYVASSNGYYSCSCPVDKVKLYLDGSYVNLATELGIGSWNSTNFSNNAISSINVPAGLKVTLYDGDFAGSSQTYTTSSSSLGAMDNITSSIKIECVPTFNRTGGNCNPYSCSVPSGVGYNGITSASGGGVINCNLGYKGSITWYCNSNATSTIQGSCTINTCSVASGTGFTGIASASGSGQISCNTGFEGSINWNCDANGNSVVSGSCNQILCSLPAGSGYGAKTGLTYSTGTGVINCEQALGYSGSINYSCTNNGAVATVLGSCTQITCPISGAGYTSRTLNYGQGSFNCDVPGFSGTISYNCNAVNTPNLSGQCLEYDCLIPSLSGFTSQKVRKGSGNLSCNAGKSGSLYYACGCLQTVTATNENGTQYQRNGFYNQIYYTWYPTNPSRLLSFSLAASGALNNGNLAMLNASRNSGLMFHSSWYAYPDASWKEINLSSSNQFFKNLDFSSFQWTTLSAGRYINVFVRSDNVGVFRVKYDEYNPNIACATPSLYYENNCVDITCTAPAANGYGSQSGLPFTATANSGTIACSQTGYTGNATYTCSSSGVATNISACNCATGYGKDGMGVCVPITCPVSLATYPNLSSYMNVALTSTAQTIPCNSGFSGGLTYTCAGTPTSSVGTLSASGNCTAITCTAPATNGYASQSGLPFTATANSGTIACSQTGYTGNANYTCTSSGVATNISACNCTAGYGKDTTGACVPITCTAPATNGYASQSGLPFTATANSGTIACSQTGYTGNVTYTCTSSGVATNISACNCTAGYGKDATGACVPITCPVSSATYPNLSSYVNVALTSTAQTIPCATGFSGGLTYTCAGTSASSIGTLSASGSCSFSSICTIPTTLNTILDGTNVGVTSAPVTSSCKSGFSGSFSYECFNDKVVLYQDPNYTGTSLAYSVGTYDYPLAIGNDAVSSVQVPNGYRLTLYQDQLGSNSLQFTSSQPTLGSFDNLTSAIIVEKISTTSSNPGALRLVNSCSLLNPNWYAWTSVGCGSYISSSSSDSVEIIGPNGCGGQWTYYFTYLPTWVTSISFNWRYCTGDWDARYDPGRFYVNNTWYDIFTNGSGNGNCYYGTFNNFAVQGGTAFGPGIYSTDGCCGVARLYFYNIVVR